MAIKRHITHIKMSGDTTPLARQLMYGELGVNYGKDREKLYIKNSEDEIIPIETEAQSHAYVDNKIISGNSLGVKVEDNNGETSSPKLGNAPIKVTHTPAGNVVQTISGSSGVTLVEGSSFDIPTVSIDQFGHVNSGSTTPVKISDTFRYITGVTNTNEINLSVDGNRILSATHSGHTNGGTASGTNNTFTLVYAKGDNQGVTFNLPTVTYNEYGHVISSGTTSVTLKLQQASESAWGDVKLVQTTGSSTELVMSQSAITYAIQQSFIENSALRYKGTVSSYAELQEKGAVHEVGDLYKVSANFTIGDVKYEPGDMFIANTSGTTFNLSHWDAIQTNINPDFYLEVAVSATTPSGDGLKLWVDTSTSPTVNTYSNTQVDGLLSHKQDLLVSTQNIKTINGESVLGSGNITIESGVSGDYVPLSGGTMTGTLTVPTVVSNSGFQKSGSDNNSVLLAGGGTKALSEIGNRVYIDGNTLVI